MEKKSISSSANIELLVNSFYQKVNEDELLSPIFNLKAGVHWESHLPKMYSFWSTQLLGTGEYKGQPFPPHMALELKTEHFQRWLKLFSETVDELFTGEAAELAKYKANNIANIFQYKLGINDQFKK